MTYTPGPYDQQYPPPQQPYGPPDGSYTTGGWQPDPQPQYAPPPPAPWQGDMGYADPAASPYQQYPPQPYPPQPYQAQPAYEPPAPVKKRRKKNTGLVVLAVVGGFCVLLCGIIAVAASNDDTPTTPATAGPARSGAAGIAQWAAGGGSALLDKLTQDFTEVGGGGTTSAIHTACAHIQTDVEAAQAYTPIPDAQAQASWSKALAMFARAASDCLAGTERQDAALQNKAAGEFDQGTAALNEAATRIKQLGG